MNCEICGNPAEESFSFYSGKALSTAYAGSSGATQKYRTQYEIKQSEEIRLCQHCIERYLRQQILNRCLIALAITVALSVLVLLDPKFWLGITPQTLVVLAPTVFLVLNFPLRTYRLVAMLYAKHFGYLGDKSSQWTNIITLDPAMWINKSSARQNLVSEDHSLDDPRQAGDMLAIRLRSNKWKQQGFTRFWTRYDYEHYPFSTDQRGRF